jgi:iron complex outermembrane receptor protein
VQPVFNTVFTPESRRALTYNGFVQDEIGLLRNAVRITAGSKFEWNSFSGFEVQPTIRLLWAPTAQQSGWTAVSRAVRVPSREEHDQNELDSISEGADGGIEYATIVASPGFKPEKLTSYEAGYRFVAAKRLSVDLATFYNVYDDLRTLETEEAVVTATPIAGLMTPLVFANNGYGRVAGVEVTAFWTVNDVLQLSGNYTRLHMRLRASAASNDEDARAFEDQNARNLLYARAYADLPYRIGLAAELRYVSAIPGEDVAGYADGNIHVSRDLLQGLRLSISVDNVVHRRHAEWNGGGLVQSRALRASLNWKF